ncbi:uncharacterized protein LOC123696035 isoform X2 [Colias croceus]|nr:uncharacterized protein LOC123696035 isoform X2 [Colias croceus]XP_045497984.1 uncharacterized protein LOC123696035 isoform X2 [Colias croceus]
MNSSASCTLESPYQNECCASKLESFDLNKPVNVTVIIDDIFHPTPFVPQDINLNELMNNVIDETYSNYHDKNLSKSKNTKARARKRARSISTMHQIPPSKQTPNFTPNVSVNPHTKNNNNEMTSMHQFINMEHNSLSVNNSLSNYVPKTTLHPLDIILYDILQIIKFYFKKTPSDQHLQYYENFKRIMFNHSYEYVLKYLIPIEHNEKVLYNFTMRITTVAKNCSLPIAFNQSRHILFQMMKWCKEKSMISPPSYNTIPTLMPENRSSISNENHIIFNNRNMNLPNTYQVESTLPAQEASFHENWDLNNLYNNANKDGNNPRLEENSHLLQIFTSKLPQHGSVLRATLNQDTNCEQKEYSIGHNVLNSSGNPPMASIFESDSLQKNNYDTYRPENVESDISQQAETDIETISRDSGFTSPLTFNFSDELELSNKEPHTEIHHDEVIPINENVTSLNKNFKLSSCNVCRKITHKMCKGCYKIFYCSIECMKAEWQLHKFFCCQSQKG